MIKIGDFSKICNVNTHTLRYYDAEGVLKPDIIDPSSGYRFYSVEAVERYKQILFYKNLGFSLDEIKKIQSATDEELWQILQQKKAELSKAIDLFREQINTIDRICEKDSKKPILFDMLLLPFENDEQMIGKWKLCGSISDENELTAPEEVFENTASDEIIFMPGGAFAWTYFWTKGTLYRISPRYTFAIPSDYKTVEKDGVRYMILQFLTDDCIENGAESILLLYRQVDHIAYTERQIRAHVDDTDLPFVDDEAVQGEWVPLDYVPSVSDFDPDTPYSTPEAIYMVNIRFVPRGICARTVRSMSGNVTYGLRYTKGFVLNDKEMTAEAYQIRTIKGKEFLFVEHKSGDYFYGGLKPHVYVYQRKET